MSSARGTSIRLQRSLQMRVVAACAMSFLGLVAVICLVMPRAYEAQTREAFAARALSLARTLAFVTDSPAADSPQHQILQEWLSTEEAYRAAAIFDPEGQVVEQWGTSIQLAAPPTTNASVHSSTNYYSALHPMTDSDGRHLAAAVQLSTEALIRDLENVRWMFAALFLFTSVVFFVLSSYLTRSILTPIVEIGRAAMDLADGEPDVQVPVTGDKEIDELGAFLHKLGESRRDSCVMESPIAVLSRHHLKTDAAGDPPPRKLAELSDAE